MNWAILRTKFSVSSGVGTQILINKLAEISYRTRKIPQSHMEIWKTSNSLKPKVLKERTKKKPNAGDGMTEP